AIDQQTVVRMNRDTLYSMAVVDLAQPATIVVPDAGDRYLSVMIVNNDHYIHQVIHEPGPHVVTSDINRTRYVLVALRILVDPNDEADLAEVHRLQDQFTVDASSAEPFVMPDYDATSFDGARSAVVELGRFAPDATRSFGTPGQVDPVRHLIGTAIGWGGLPETEAMYLNVEPRLPVGEYELHVGDVPVDAFWSISLYNAEGFFEANDRDAYSVNSVTAERSPDGTVTVHFGGCGDGRPNCLPIMEGWNYIVRLYRPRPEVLDGSWTFPSVEPVGG
ncbi:MAG: DUF1214 domain-containing protein, partial [Ilumatobacteraceae bacterium]|nr:DUF1214 domain-containing protein [Ilumatobacteraceae bacterium]